MFWNCVILKLVVQKKKIFFILKTYHVASERIGGRHDYKRDNFRYEWYNFIVH